MNPASPAPRPAFARPLSAVAFRRQLEQLRRKAARIAAAITRAEAGR